MRASRLTLKSHPAGWIWAGLALLLLTALAVLPRSANAGALPGELPTLVGRLSALTGDVRWYDRDSGRWVASTEQQPLRNWPIAAGDRLSTGPLGRAELRVGSTTLRLGADAELWLTQLDEQGVLLHLRAGSLAVRLAAVDQDGFGPVTLLTREGRWLPQRPGHYRLDRDRDATQATAWRGELRFESHDSALTIAAGRRADLWQDPPGTTRYAWAGVERDNFADWVARDERQDDAPQSARHVPPGMTGWQDLDRHGDWLDDPEYGSVWQPRVVAPGWAPFHDGRWAWVQPWGWTWIDAAPWGFAPFHYGVWVTVGGRWSWSPGPRHQPPRYAPAHSGWVSGANWGVNIRIGGHRPPPPRVVVPVVRPRFDGRPPVVVGPPRPIRPEPTRPPFSGPREQDRRDADRRDNDRRDNDRRDNDRRDNDRRDLDRRDPGPRAPVTGGAVDPRTPWRDGRPDGRPETRPEVRPEVRPEGRPDGRPGRSDNRSERGDVRGAATAEMVGPVPPVRQAQPVRALPPPNAPPLATTAPPARPAEPPRASPPPSVVPATPVATAVPAAPAAEPPRRTLPAPVVRPQRDDADPREGRGGKPGRDESRGPDGRRGDRDERANSR